MTSTLENRYGVTRQKKVLPRWFWYVAAVLASLLGIAFVAWVQLAGSAQPTSRDAGFSLVSDSQVTVSFELVKRPEDSAVCVVKALNSSRAPVGWKEVTIGPSAESVSVQQVSLRTLSEATTVTVDSCWKAE